MFNENILCSIQAQLAGQPPGSPLTVQDFIKQEVNTFGDVDENPAAAFQDPDTSSSRQSPTLNMPSHTISNKHQGAHKLMTSHNDGSSQGHMMRSQGHVRSPVVTSSEDAPVNMTTTTGKRGLTMIKTEPVVIEPQCSESSSSVGQMDMKCYHISGRNLLMLLCVIQIKDIHANFFSSTE